jgi:hypothetical protein
MLRRKDEKAELFAGSEKYHKKNVFNPELAGIPVEKKIALIHESKMASSPTIRGSVRSSRFLTKSEKPFRVLQLPWLEAQTEEQLLRLVAAVNGKVEEVKTAWDVSLGQ